MGNKIKHRQQAPETQTENLNVEDANKVSKETLQLHKDGLSPDARAMLLHDMHERFYKDPNAVKSTGISKDGVEIINKIVAADMVAALVVEHTVARNPFTQLMPPQMMEAIKLVGEELGVSLKTNLLPAPDEDGNVQVPSEAVVITKEAKAAAKEEAKIKNAVPNTNPKEAKSNEDVRAAAVFLLTDTKTHVRPYDRINDAIVYYQNYLRFQANGDKKREEEVKNMSRTELFEELIGIIGTCPFSIGGISKVLYNVTAQTKTPIPAFCMFRTASLNKQTGTPTFDDDQAVADFVKILVTWSANSQIEKDNEAIKKLDSKADKDKISRLKEQIKAHEEVISYVKNPDSGIVDAFAASYNDVKHDNYKISRRITSQILNNYYNGVDPKDVDNNWIVKNIPIFAATTLNLFRDPLSPIMGYNASDIEELVRVQVQEPQEKTLEEKKEELKSKKQAKEAAESEGESKK